MKKYLYIFKTEIINNLQYTLNIITNIFSYFIFIYIFMQVWKYIYADPSSYINGFNMYQMIWYLIITELIYNLTGGKKLVRKIAEDVKSGNIAYNINKPYDYIGYSIFSHLGSVIVKGIFFSLSAALIGLILVKRFIVINLLQIFLVMITIILAITINSMFMILIGLFSFLLEDSTPIYWIYSKIILICGITFPIECFPKVVQPLLTYSPVFVTVYGPAKLFVKFNYLFFLKVIGAQFIYLIMVILIAELVYKKGVRKINVNGG